MCHQLTLTCVWKRVHECFCVCMYSGNVHVLYNLGRYYSSLASALCVLFAQPELAQYGGDGEAIFLDWAVIKVITAVNVYFPSNISGDSLCYYVI